ncbi:MAG: DUF4412 domain-containing protein [Bacteroidota bacterium]|nr:DUF4412 domain-containing protein [Bacteroidota bacterium]
MLKKIIPVLSIVLFVHITIANSSLKDSIFEGIIVYQKASLSDTVIMNVFIKEDRVRVDEYDLEGKLLKGRIMDFKSERMIILQPDRKIYTTKAVLPGNKLYASEVAIEKTQNHKTVNNMEVYQWIVKNKKRNSVVSYWVADMNYNYFGHLFRYLNCSDKISEFYDLIPVTAGFIPLQAVEHSLVRDTRMSFNAVKVFRTGVNSNQFVVPSDYSLFE